MVKTFNIALIGQSFMGRAHSNAWGQAPRFFELPVRPVMHTVVARNAELLPGFAERFGWANWTTDVEAVAADGEVDLVDVSTPNDSHRSLSVRMLEAGKHVACEKPLAGTLREAREMRDAARKAKGCKTFVWFNYRRCPAVALAYKIIRSGRLGEIYHVRASYLQGWGGPQTPLLWRFQKAAAGSGAHGDLNAHIVDLARFLTGDEIHEVNGAIAKTFVKERKRLDGPGKGRSTVDDSVQFLATFKGGATASFEATRLAGGHFNDNSIELNGSKGSLRWSLERLNELEFFDNTEDAVVRGWHNIMVTDGDAHPYVGNWWPEGHIVGYEHSFTNQVVDICRVMGRRKPEVPLPDFEDAYQTQRVLEAALIAAKRRSAVKMSEVK
jgi:predicted dehydrogenase